LAVIVPKPAPAFASTAGDSVAENIFLKNLKMTVALFWIF